MDDVPRAEPAAIVIRRADESGPPLEAEMVPPARVQDGVSSPCDELGLALPQRAVAGCIGDQRLDRDLSQQRRSLVAAI
jgi:hypothetical protein